MALSKIAPGDFVATLVRPVTQSRSYSFQYINAAELPVPAGVRYSAW